MTPRNVLRPGLLPDTDDAQAGRTWRYEAEDAADYNGGEGRGKYTVAYVYERRLHGIAYDVEIHGYGADLSHYGGAHAGRILPDGSARFSVDRMTLAEAAAAVEVLLVEDGWTVISDRWRAGEVTS